MGLTSELLYKKLKEGPIFLDMYSGMVEALCKIKIYKKVILKLAGPSWDALETQINTCY